jgi:hypothetical protein
MNLPSNVVNLCQTSMLRAAIIDVPIAAVVAPLADPNVPILGVTTITFIGATMNYVIRGLAREYYHPYIGAVIGGTFYHSLADIFGEGITFKTVFEGSARQLGYELNLDYNPYSETAGGMLAPAIAIEAFQSILEGHSIQRGALMGLYVGAVFEILYNPLVSYYSLPSNPGFDEGS